MQNKRNYLRQARKNKLQGLQYKEQTKHIVYLYCN